MFDCLLKNGTVVDGTGGAPFTADVAIQDGSIAAVAPGLGGSAVRVVDARGLVVTPGFIDIHRHADAAVFRPGFGEGELRQGITTIVNGNCGLSIAPYAPARREEFLQYLAPITGPLPEEVHFATFGEYLLRLEERPLPLNVGMLVGSGTLRAACAGFATPVLDEDTLPRLHSLLQQALFMGAFGVSVGLGYLPDSHYTAETLAKALEPIAKTDLPVTVHLRGEGALLADSVAEMLAAARLLDVPLHVSHFKCIGPGNWGTQTKAAIRRMEEAREEGAIVSCDMYPWTAGSTQLACLLPPAFLQDGFAGAARLLQNPAERARCKQIMQQPSNEFENISLLVGWDNIIPGDSAVSVGEIARQRGCDPCDAAFDLLVEHEGDLSMVDTICCEEDIEAILKLPYSSIISDAVYPVRGRLHPRNFATVPRVIEEYVNRRRVLSLAEAVYKMTGGPAAALGLRQKGKLFPGKDADVVVFDANALHSDATYQNPQQCCTGVRLVLVNGQPAVENDSLTGQNAGRLLRR